MDRSLKMVKGFDDIKVRYNVSYSTTDGKDCAKEVEALSEYQATGIVALEVNNGKNYGFNFKATFVGF